MQYLTHAGVYLFLLFFFCADTKGQPSFRPENVKLHGSTDFYPMTPGSLVWIFGTGLSGNQNCVVKNSMDPATYQTELCGTKVLVGGIIAKLVAVSSQQINLVIPDHAWADQFIPIQISSQGMKSDPVPVFFGSTRPILSVARQLFTGMPIWIHVSKTWKHNEIRYPFSLEPWDFGAGEFEVKFQGKELPRILDRSSPLNGLMISIPGSFTEKQLHRLPLHLIYSLDQPGKYLIRYTEYKNIPHKKYSQKKVFMQSDWIEIEVLSSTKQQRQQWLKDLSAKTPATVVETLSEYLPDLLAMRNEEALRILAPFLNSEDVIVKQYAGYALNYFDVSLLQKVVPHHVPLKGGVR